MHGFVGAIALAASVFGSVSLTQALRVVSAPRTVRAVVIRVGAAGQITHLSAHTVWRAGARVALDGPVWVGAGATLDIEAGVTVEAAPGASIVVERNGRLIVVGTQTEPVILTCPGNAITPGCWDGIVVLGHAPINHGALTSPDGGRGGVGGCRESTLNAVPYGGCNAADSSGVIRYLRVQYATNGMRLFGVGSKTAVHDVQVHRSTGHGLEIVGGTVPLRHLALTTNAQYGLTYSGGWTGQAQYVVIQQDATGYAGGLLGRNAQGAGGNQNATPRSAPTLSNLTIVAPPSAAGNPYASAAPAALRFDRGAAGELYNVLLIEPAIAVDIDDASTCTQVAGGILRLHGIGLTAPATMADPDADPAECAPSAESSLLAGATTVTGAAAATQLQSALDVVLPDLRARPGSAIALATGLAPPITGILEAVTYLGAVAPSASTGTIPWYSGWTVGEQLAAPMLVTLHGLVTAPGRGGIPGVQVLVNPSGLNATTNVLGQFAIPGVPTGPVEVAFTAGVPGDCATPEVVRAVANGGTMMLADVRLECGPPAPALVQRSIVAGDGHTCGLTSAGAAYCWGDNRLSQLGDGTTTQRLTPTLVSAGYAFSTLTAGGNHTCALTSAGHAYCWGFNGNGRLGDGTTIQRLAPTLVSGGQVFATLTAGRFHTCGLSASGTAFCWGANSTGQVGDGTQEERLVPTLVSGSQVFASLAVGASHTCGLTRAATAFCWGRNFEGQLGDGTQSPRFAPTHVTGVQAFTMLTAGGSHTCGLTSTGASFCWGDNSSGQLGDGTITRHLAPTLVSGGNAFTTLTAGGNHTCGQTSAGAASCWGDNSSGQLGDGTLTRRLTPALVGRGQAFAAVAAGGGHTCGLAGAGVAYCWGQNGSGQLGDGSDGLERLSPTPVSGAYAFTVLTAGVDHTCGLTTAGAAYCWGRNFHGSLGDGTNTDRVVPTLVSGGQTFTTLTAGTAYTCGRTSAGAAFCWGANFLGGLGDGTATSRLTPTPVSGGQAFTTLTAGRFHTCGVTSAGAAFCWGINFSGQLGDGTQEQRLTPSPVSSGQLFATLTAGADHTCGLTTTGAAFCWGQNGSGQLGDGTAGEQRLTPTPVIGGYVFTTLTAGADHTCGVTSAGAAYCWGRNFSGPLGDGTNANRFAPTLVSGAQAFTALAAGLEYTCGVTSATAAFCWGENGSGQLGDGTTTVRLAPTVVGGGLMFTRMTAGGSHTCGRTSAGAASCWGSNSNGQLGIGGPRPVIGGIVFRVP